MTTPAPIGGSEAAAAAGVDRRCSRVELWARKLGLMPERESNGAMALGNRLQPVVAELLSERGYEVMPAPAEGFKSEPDTEGTSAPTLAFPAAQGSEPRAGSLPAPFPMIGHPDGFAVVEGARAVAEIKTAGLGTAPDWREGQTPSNVLCQVHHYLYLTGLDVALIGALVGDYGGLQLHVRIVERDARLLDLLLEREADFWGFVVRNEPPPPDGSDSAADTIRSLYPQAVEGEAVRLLGDDWERFRELKARREQLAEVKRQTDELEQWLKVRLGTAERAVSPHDDEVATWVNVERNALDVKTLKAEAPHVAATYTKTTTTRRLTVK